MRTLRVTTVGTARTIAMAIVGGAALSLSLSLSLSASAQNSEILSLSLRREPVGEPGGGAKTSRRRRPATVGQSGSILRGLLDMLDHEVLARAALRHQVQAELPHGRHDGWTRAVVRTGILWLRGDARK